MINHDGKVLVNDVWGASGGVVVIIGDYTNQVNYKTLSLKNGHYGMIQKRILTMSNSIWTLLHRADPEPVLTDAVLAVVKSWRNHLDDNSIYETSPQLRDSLTNLRRAFHGTKTE